MTARDLTRPDVLTDADREELLAAVCQHPDGSLSGHSHATQLAALAPVVARMVAEAADAREAEVRARVEAAALMEPWGPFEMGGFEGCTDRNPDVCACATDQQPTCHDCGREIEPGEMAWSRQWPCYETLPLDHRDQDWDVISWHDSCLDLREARND